MFQVCFSFMFCPLEKLLKLPDSPSASPLKWSLGTVSRGKTYSIGDLFPMYPGCKLELKRWWRLSWTTLNHPLSGMSDKFCNRVQPRGGAQTGICNGVQKRLEIIGSTPQGHTCPECWQLWPVVGGARNGAAEEDWCWDLNPGVAAIWRLFLGPCVFSETMQLWQRVRTTRHWKCSLSPHGWCLEPESQTSTSFLRYGKPDWEKGRRKDCVHLWVF